LQGTVALAGLSRQQNASAREQDQSALMIRADADPNLALLTPSSNIIFPTYPPRSAALCTVPDKRRTTLHYDWVLSYRPTVALFS
jgi:hypothetical protein